MYVTAYRPGFRPLRICADLPDFFLQDSAKIVALNLEEPYKSAHFTELCRFSLKIFAEICFSAASKQPKYCNFGLPQLRYQVF